MNILFAVRSSFDHPRPATYPSHKNATKLHLSSNGNLNLNTGLDVDDDLLNNLSGGVKTRSILVSIFLYCAHYACGGTEKTYSMRRLWMRISKQSQVLEPSPQGVLRVVTFKTLVGRRTGPLTRSDLDLARSMRSVVTIQLISPSISKFVVELVVWLLTLLERGDVARSEGDADAVDLGTLAELALLWFVVRHCREKMRKDSVYVESRLLSDDGGRGCTDGCGLW